MNQNTRLVIFHIAAWLVYVLILFLGVNKPGHDFWTNTISTLIPIIILFYFNLFFLFPRFLQSKKITLLIIFLVAFNLVTICLRHLMAMFILQSGLEGFIQNVFSPVAFWNQFRVNLLFIGISFALWYAVRNYKTEKKQVLLQREILDARLRSLQYQINPHFLHNTLSLLYTKSLAHSTELASAICKLSEMMRYSLAEPERDGKVLLEKETDHIKNFIDIQRMRFDNNLHIDLTTEGRLQECRVIPLLLITFVENAFKHGQLNDHHHPLTIRVTASDKLLIFQIQNRKSMDRKERSHGIGLQNIRNRLELIYPGKHELDIRDNKDEFIVNLKLATV